MSKRADRHPVNVHCGSRLRLRRTEMGLSQMALAPKIGISHQQLQKYETGLNPMKAERLYQIANILGVEPGYFFDDMPDLIAGEVNPTAPPVGVVASREALNVMKMYAVLPSKWKPIVKLMLHHLTAAPDPIKEET